MQFRQAASVDPVRHQQPRDGVRRAIGRPYGAPDGIVERLHRLGAFLVPPPRANCAGIGVNDVPAVAFLALEAETVRALEDRAKRLRFFLRLAGRSERARHDPGITV